MKFLVAAALCLLIAALTACPPGEPMPADDIDGRWQLESGMRAAQPLPVVDEREPTLVIIEDDEASGQAPCNAYSASLKREGNDLTFGQLRLTGRACLEEGVMASEKAYVSALRDIRSAVLEDGRLVLRGSDVELVYTPANSDDSA